MKRWFIVAVCLVIVGILMITVAMSINGWDFEKLSTIEYVENVYEVYDDFRHIYIDTNTADINFHLSSDGFAKIVTVSDEKLNYAVEVSGKTLNIKLIDERKWYDHIGISGGDEKIDVYLPEDEYAELTIKNKTGYLMIPSYFSFRNVDVSMVTGEIKCLADVTNMLRIKSSTGDVTVEDVSLGELNVDVNTSDVKLSGVSISGNVNFSTSTGELKATSLSCRNFIAETDTGNLKLENVIVAERFDFESDTGDVKFEACDAAEMHIETDTGDVRGSLLSDKVFLVEAHTGNVEVPKSISGGRCKIETDTGDVKISIVK